jgi:hypothetical protein
MVIRPNSPHRHKSPEKKRQVKKNSGKFKVHCVKIVKTDGIIFYITKSFWDK